MVVMLPYCDIHAHLADERLAGQVEAILAEGRRRGVAGILATAARRHEWESVVAIARWPGVQAAIGLHPFFIDAWTEDVPSRLATAAEAPGSGVRAIGEIGLDFTEGRATAEAQMRALTGQLEVAVRLGLPAVLHNRRSWSDFLPLWSRVAAGRIAGVCHHFAGSLPITRQALDAGLYLSFCGPLTYANARRLKEAARYAPADRLLTETDTPDLPVAHACPGPSRPWHVADIVAEMATLRGVSEAAVAETVWANYRAVLRLDSPADTSGRAGPPALAPCRSR